jgi:hypothetical protein
MRPAPRGPAHMKHKVAAVSQQAIVSFPRRGLTIDI